MLITRPFIDPEKKLDLDLEECGIRKCSRKIIYFVDKMEFLAGTCKFGKAIQINLCVESGVISDSMRKFGLVTKNVANVRNSVYKYDVLFPYGTEDLYTAILTLKDAYSVEEINDFDDRLAYRNNVGTYNKDVSTLDGKIEMFDTCDRTCITLPKYYNEEHQRIGEGEKLDSIVWLTHSINYEAHELVDHYTVIEVHDIKTYDTLMSTIIRQIQMKSANRTEINNVNLISDAFILTAESLMNGYSFIYDTQMGMNVLPIPGVTSVPYSSFRLKENLISNLQVLKDFVEQEAHLIEQQYGSIRLYYVPLMSGDKLDVKYKDYKNENQPDFNSTKIDKGYSIEENINDEYQEIISAYTSDGADF